MKKVFSLVKEVFEIVRVKVAPVAARYNVHLRARIMSRSEDVIAEVLDVSESGCFALLDHQIEVGSLVGIDFRYGNFKVHAVAVVVRNTKRPSGCGFMFVAATRAERQAIRGLIRRLEGDSLRNSSKQAA
jgi:hypothetical protein